MNIISFSESLKFLDNSILFTVPQNFELSKFNFMNDSATKLSSISYYYKLIILLKYYKCFNRPFIVMYWIRKCYQFNINMISIKNKKTIWLNISCISVNSIINQLLNNCRVHCFHFVYLHTKNIFVYIEIF